MASSADITETTVKLYWGASPESDQVSYYSVEKFTLENQQVCGLFIERIRNNVSCSLCANDLSRRSWRDKIIPCFIRKLLSYGIIILLGRVK